MPLHVQPWDSGKEKELGLGESVLPPGIIKSKAGQEGVDLTDISSAIMASIGCDWVEDEKVGKLPGAAGPVC